MERMRAVARATGAGPGLLVQEAAGALAALGGDQAGLVTACRRLVERHPAVGPLWWLASRVLCAPDPVVEAYRAAAEIEADTTPAALAAALPEDTTLVLLGWPELAVDGVRRRGDADVLLVSGRGEAAGLARRLQSAGVAVEEVPDSGLGAAVAEAGLVVLEAGAVGPDGFLAAPGSRAAVAVAAACGVPVWVVAGTGRVLPPRLWSALKANVDRSALAVWERDEELVPLALCDQLVMADGLRPPSGEGAGEVCPVAPELLKPMV